MRLNRLPNTQQMKLSWANSRMAELHTAHLNLAGSQPLTAI